MKVLFFNEKKNKYGIKDLETNTIIIDALNDGDKVTVMDPETCQFNQDTIRIDPTVKKYFLEYLQFMGRMENLQVL